MYIVQADFCLSSPLHTSTSKGWILGMFLFVRYFNLNIAVDFLILLDPAILYSCGFNDMVGGHERIDQ